MMQELLGTPTLIGSDRKILPFNGGIILEGTPNSPLHPNLSSPWATPSSATSFPGSGFGVGVGAAADAPPLTKNHSNSSTEGNNNNNSSNCGLRCPRCDSSNTKFCYYNNYNLTQPRHFCKTCRRYWTKGGALRNVPIGGGCRKSRPSASSSSPTSSTSSKSGGSKFKTLVSELGRPSLIPGFDNENIIPPPPIPVFWASGPNNSHILSLLKGSQSPSPNYGDPQPAPAFLPFKEETTLLGGFPIPESAISPHSGVNGRSPGGELVGHPHSYHLQQQNCVVTGMQSLFQRPEPPTGNNYNPESNGNRIAQAVQCNRAGTNTQSQSSTILESVPAATTSELGYWNPAFSLSDLPTANGASYP
ncbi:hypothetical protein MLD38_009234 [Melastoma candidum]|uniref:Uncharacterized protein n=1 Tax=Melastoma candidum TaxID=119954 RepID=A0ACB9S5F8_9MYRT|nr:hypothetical protein MLD38_009234 [Melastoma candidum]